MHRGCACRKIYRVRSFTLRYRHDCTFPESRGRNKVNSISIKYTFFRRGRKSMSILVGPWRYHVVHLAALRGPAGAAHRRQLRRLYPTNQTYAAAAAALYVSIIIERPTRNIDGRSQHEDTSTPMFSDRRGLRLGFYDAYLRYLSVYWLSRW